MVADGNRRKAAERRSSLVVAGVSRAETRRGGESWFTDRKEIQEAKEGGRERESSFRDGREGFLEAAAFEILLPSRRCVDTAKIIAALS